MNVGFISTRLAGTDGVTLETVKWARICRDLGHNTFFCAGQLDPDPTVFERFGLFLSTADGIKKVELSKDTMPNGSKAADNSIGLGSLNNKGDVVFSIRLSGPIA